MKKGSTAAAKASKKISGQKLTVGLDLGDRSSWYCMLDEAGAILREQRVSTTAKALGEVLGSRPRSRIALETGGDVVPIVELCLELVDRDRVAFAGRGPLLDDVGTSVGQMGEVLLDGVGNLTGFRQLLKRRVEPIEVSLEIGQAQLQTSGVRKHLSQASS